MRLTIKHIKYAICFLIFWLPEVLIAQNVGINTLTPDNSALMDLYSKERGLLLPRMTTAERKNIDLSGNPESLLIFNTDSMCFQTWLEEKWFNLWCLKDSFDCGKSLNYGGQSYATVQIGSQCWMAENLNLGIMIPGASDQTDNGIVEKYCLNDDSSNCDIYGAIYQWQEVMNYSSSCNGTGAPPDDACASPVRGICPPGWHIPSHYEWTTLEENIGSSAPGTFPYDDTTAGWHGIDEGGRLKETGTSHWASPNTGATNSSGFTGLPAGIRTTGSGFVINTGSSGYFWSSTGDGSDNVWTRNLTYDQADINKKVWNEMMGLSVRCVKK